MATNRHNEYSIVYRRISRCYNFLDGFKVNSERGTAETSNAEGTRFATVPQIGMSGVPQVRVGVVGRAMQLVGNHTHFCAIQE